MLPFKSRAALNLKTQNKKRFLMTNSKGGQSKDNKSKTLHILILKMHWIERGINKNLKIQLKTNFYNNLKEAKKRKLIKRLKNQSTLSTINWKKSFIRVFSLCLLKFLNPSLIISRQALTTPPYSISWVKIHIIMLHWQKKTSKTWTISSITISLKTILNNQCVLS